MPVVTGYLNTDELLSIFYVHGFSKIDSIFAGHSHTCSKWENPFEIHGWPWVYR